MPDDASIGGRLDFPLGGIASFLRAPICTDLDRLDADIVVLGAPTDEGSPFMPGSRFGPRSIREHSLRFVGPEPGYFDPQLRRHFLEREVAQRRIVDAGDADVLPTNVVGTFDNITASVRSILAAGALPVVLGGDHAVTFPVVRAFEDTGPLHVLHFDAHIDYMPFVHGLEYTNQHAFRHIRAMPNITGIRQIGIRSIRNSQVMLDDSERDGNDVVMMQEVRERGVEAVLGSIEPDTRCYVSIDIDVLDMTLTPGCVSAEPEGMGYGELRDALRAVARQVDVVGFDLVEVNPMLDVRTGLTSYLAAHAVIEFLGAICDQPRWRSARGGR